MINYKFNEDELLEELKKYVDSTYDSHYSKDREFQATEFIIDSGHGIGFTVSSVIKYAQRYGHKGDPRDWRKDLMKIAHYAIIALHTHDKENGSIEPTIPSTTVNLNEHGVMTPEQSEKYNDTMKREKPR